MTETDTDAATPAPTASEPRWVGRVVLYGLPLLLSLCAVLSLNYWPYTSAELFSRVRTNEQSETQVRAELPDGRTVRIAETVQLYHTPALPQRKISRSLCALWAEAAEDQYGEAVTDIRAYRVRNHLTRTADTVEKRIVSEKLVWTCPT